MSEELATTDWASPDEMAYWRERVKERADQHLAMYPNAKRSAEIAKPEQSAMALWMIANGRTKKDACEKTGLAGNEIWRLSRHHVGTLAQFLEKKRPELAARYLHVAEQTVGLLEKKIDQLESDDEALAGEKLKDLALGFGIVNDKAMQLAGVATVRIEHVKGPSIEDYEELINAARKRLSESAIEAEVISDGVEEA